MPFASRYSAAFIKLPIARPKIAAISESQSSIAVVYAVLGNKKTPRKEGFLNTVIDYGVTSPPTTQ